MIALTLRLLKRDGLAGEWQILLAALTIAVAAMSAVGFFSSRVNLALTQEAHGLLAADLVINSDHALPEDYGKQAAALGLTLANTAQFPTMAIASSGAKLVTLKAASNNYPLRGKMTLLDNDVEVNVKGTPLPGTAWIDARLMQELNLRLTNSLQLGDLKVTIVGVIGKEPDNTVNLMSFTPRVLINFEDLPKTNLAVEGSRIRYRLLLAGSDSIIKAFAEKIATQLQRGEQLESIDNARPELKSALERARQFMALTALASVALAAAAIGLAARRYALRHVDGVAILACIGVSKQKLLFIYGGQWLVIGLIGCLLGTLLGYIAQGPLAQILAPAFAGQLPSAGLLPGVIAAGCGMILLAGFGWPSLSTLLRTPGLHALRGQFQKPSLSLWLVILSMLAALLILLWLQTGQAKLSAYALLTFGLMSLIGLAGGFGLLMLVNISKRWLSPHYRIMVSGLSRHRGLTVTQTASLALSAMALLTLTVVRGQLMNNWQQSIPADAPNHFLINIQAEQRQAVTQAFQQFGISSIVMSPMVRGRLIKINQQVITGDTYVDERARSLAEREFNLSSNTELASDNQIISGRWFGKNSSKGWSIEEGIAETLKIKLGDQLEFDIAGSVISAPVSSVRKVRWDSFKPNFFVLASPGLLEQQPTSYISALYVPPDKTSSVEGLIRSQPNITAINVTTVMENVKQLIDRVSKVVQYLFLFSLASGVVVMYATMAISQDERRAEIALLRTLGSRRQQVWRGLITETLLIGAMAGFLAAAAANLLGFAVSYWLLQLPWSPNYWSFAWGILGCAGLTLFLTWPWARKLMNTSPALVLRES